jgi:hypothetical protein
MNKRLFTFGIVFIFYILFAGISLSSSQTTSLNVKNNVELPATQTNYILTGDSDVNASIYLNSNELNLNEMITADSNGKFSYNLNISQDITDVKVSITASSKDKEKNSTTVSIQRPTTKLNLNSIDNFTDNDSQITISGITEPNANLTISSENLSINNLPIALNGDGSFKYVISVPKNINSFSIKAESKILGEKVGKDSISVTRKLTPPPTPITPTSNEESSSSTGGPFGNGYSYCYSASSKVYHTHNCGHLPQQKNRKYSNTIPSGKKLCSFCA